MIISPKKKKDLLNRAKKVLAGNWTGHSTKPAPNLYPHQWNWDSGFIAIGYAHYNPYRAIKEITSLFKGQWKNGMLPHIIFNKKSKGYFPDSTYWDTSISKNAPNNAATSGITQPPTQATAVHKIYQCAKNNRNVIKFLKSIYPKLLASHRYLHNERDPEKSGLITIFHPWESGFDNSPRWDESLSRIKPRNLPKYKRVDLQHVGNTERPTNEEYDKYIYLIEIMKKNKYDSKKVYEQNLFLIKDVVFTSILYVANENLIKLAKVLNNDTSEIEKWNKTIRKNFAHFFCPHLKSDCLFYDYDVITKKNIIKRSISSLLPLYTGIIDKTHAKTTLKWLSDDHFCGDGVCKYLIAPTIDIHSKHFKAVEYWRGPVWINVNWMLYHGLRKYNFNKKADELKNAIINLINENGFYEYFNPMTGKGLGGNKFSWTAALLIDLLMEKRNK